jgi:hypothetical protein
MTIKRDKTKKAFSGYAYSSHIIPCGRCSACVARRRDQWAFRLYQEALNSDSMCFMTMTYGENYDTSTGEYIYGENPEYVIYEGKPYDTLNREHVKKFHRALRQRLDLDRFKYYTIGEYGSQGGRPHYHSIMFNLPDKIIKNSQLVAEDFWRRGQVDIGTVTIASIKYVTGYFYKSFRAVKESKIPSPFAIMSKRIGECYVNNENIVDHHKRNLDPTVRMPGGYKIPMPRYYRDKIFDSDEKLIFQDYYRQLMENPNGHLPAEVTPDRTRLEEYKANQKLQELQNKSI